MRKKHSLAFTHPLLLKPGYGTITHMPEPLVRATHVVKEYKLGKVVVPAIRDISFDIQPGEFLALVGPSGSGKSTLLNLLGGLDRPTSGDLVVEGKNLRQLKDEAFAQYRQATVGMIFQSFNLLPDLTAIQNVLLPITLAGTNEKVATERAQKLFERVGMKERERHKPTELSGGEQQRLAIVRALMNKPKIILADEPTGNLDRATGRTVISLLMEICRQEQVVLLVVTHNEEIAGQADRKLHLVDGKLNGNGGGV